MNQEIKEKLMRLAMSEADQAVQEGNSPFGAVLADLDGNVIASAHNNTKSTQDPVAHAEVNLIRKIVRQTQSKDLSNYYMIINALPCPMCAAVCIKYKIKNYILGADNEKHMNPYIKIFAIARYSHELVNIETGILKEECQKQIEEARKIMK